MAEPVTELADKGIGLITIHPTVLVTIAQLTALSVEGVCYMASHTPARPLGLPGASREGTRVVVDGGVVSVDLYVVAQSHANMFSVGRSVQSEVTRAVEEMVGMAVREVNVHIEDVHIPCP
jgi:uncharacterized alkaline shock family protein YloU